MWRWRIHARSRATDPLVLFSLDRHTKFRSAKAGVRHSELVDIELLEPAYRASIFSTQPQKRIVVRLAVLARRLKEIDVKVQITLHNSAGDQLAEATLEHVGQEAVFVASGLPPGQYAVRYRTDAAFTIERSPTITILPPAPSEVYLDAEGVCMVDGKRFFPVGLFHVGDNLTMINKDNEELGEPPLTYEKIVRRVAAKGFNTIVTTSTGNSALTWRPNTVSTWSSTRTWVANLSNGGAPDFASIRHCLAGARVTNRRRNL